MTKKEILNGVERPFRSRMRITWGKKRGMWLLCERESVFRKEDLLGNRFHLILSNLHSVKIWQSSKYLYSPPFQFAMFLCVIKAHSHKVSLP